MLWRIEKRICILGPPADHFPALRFYNEKYEAFSVRNAISNGTQWNFFSVNIFAHSMSRQTAVVL